jgi:hypothetical protein
LCKREEDPFNKLMELSLYDAQNPIRDLMEHGRSKADPLLDEEDTQSDTTILSRIVTEGDDTRTLQKITGTSSLVDWADQNIGDTHMGKQKHKTMTMKGKGKNKRECLQAMRELLVQKGSQNTKNPLTMVGMEEINIILNHLVGAPSS